MVHGKGLGDTIGSQIRHKDSITIYNENVLLYLEYLGYPKMVQGFNPNDVAASITDTVIAFYSRNLSVRLCAITIWSLTMQSQIILSLRSIQ